MDKSGNSIHSDKEYALKQLANLKQDLSNMTLAIDRKLDDIDKVICGLTKGHNWQLHEFSDNTYPFAKPPGVYKFKCIDCGEIIIPILYDSREFENYIRELISDKKTVIRNLNRGIGGRHCLDTQQKATS